jgi:hypothetical protein
LFNLLFDVSTIGFVTGCLVKITANVFGLYAGRISCKLNLFFGSARAYHCEAKPGTANRKDRLA